MYYKLVKYINGKIITGEGLLPLIDIYVPVLPDSLPYPTGQPLEIDYPDNFTGWQEAVHEWKVANYDPWLEREQLRDLIVRDFAKLLKANFITAEARRTELRINTTQVSAYTHFARKILGIYQPKAVDYKNFIANYAMRATESKIC